jgi:hypothetical protein
MHTYAYIYIHAAEHQYQDSSYRMKNVIIIQEKYINDSLILLKLSFIVIFKRVQIKKIN